MLKHPSPNSGEQQGCTSAAASSPTLFSQISAGWPSYKSINQPVFLYQSLFSNSFGVQRKRGGRFVDQDPVATPLLLVAPFTIYLTTNPCSVFLLPVSAQSPSFLFTCQDDSVSLSLAVSCSPFLCSFLSYFSSFFSLSLCHLLHHRREVGQQDSLPLLL